MHGKAQEIGREIDHIAYFVSCTRLARPRNALNNDPANCSHFCLVFKLDLMSTKMPPCTILIIESFNHFRCFIHIFTCV